MKKIKYTAKEILKSKTPEEYIDRCLNSNLSANEKSQLAIEWFEKTGFTIDDVKYARHRHPYWKAEKMKGFKQRNARRWKLHDYSSNKNKKKKDKKRKFWTEEELITFVFLNRKDSSTDKYIYTDAYLAKKFSTTISSIQNLRRKANVIRKIKKHIKVSSRREIMMMTKSDKALKKDLKKLMS